MENIDNIYPVRRCEYEVNAEIVTVLFVKEKLNFIEKTFFKKISLKPQKVDLDEIGSFIWLNCDGNNSVADILSKSRNKFGEKIEPAESRVDIFINQLNKNRLINMFEKRTKES
ncbi:MAG: PqqD family protein [Melioribacteraceae bacterium]|nr:PqqD family protein [Saprospiraceae bacterium]MCF8356613.1 PqqD family protein [Melioribacteraceae bacterium]MCF8395997.1 PqqD family protein [Melioribacteraceae bacterium]